MKPSKDLYEGTITVGQLIRDLGAFDADRLVVMSKDGEGNGFSPLAGVGTASYEADSTWSGEVGMEQHELTEEKRKEGYGDEDVLQDGVPALVLWPTN